MINLVTHPFIQKLSQDYHIDLLSVYMTKVHIKFNKVKLFPTETELKIVNHREWTARKFDQLSVRYINDQKMIGSKISTS